MRKSNAGGLDFNEAQNYQTQNESTNKLLMKKQEAIRSEQVNSFLDKLKNNQQSLNFFVKQYNKEQQMTFGKSKVHGLQLGMGALSTSMYSGQAPLSRQQNVGYQSALNGHSKFLSQPEVGIRNVKTQDSRWRSKLIPEKGINRNFNQTTTSFFGSRGNRLQTAATMQDHRASRKAQTQVRNQESNIIDDSFSKSQNEMGRQENFSMTQQNIKVNQNRSMIMENQSQLSQSFKNYKQVERPGTYSSYYYNKFIHQENRKILVSQQNQRTKFIPECEAEHSSFQQRFKSYMDKFNQEEDLNFLTELQQKKQKLAEEMALTDFKLKLGTRSVLVGKQSDFKDRNENGFEDSPAFIKLKQHQNQEAITLHQNGSRSQSPNARLKVQINLKNNYESPQQPLMYKDISHLVENRNKLDVNNPKIHLSKTSNTQMIDNEFEQSYGKQSKLMDNIKGKNLKPKKERKISSQEEDKKLPRNQIQNELSDQDPYNQEKTHKPRKKRVSHAVYLDNLKKLKDIIKGDHFKQICQIDSQANQNIQFRNCRLTKVKFKQFIAQKYGNILAEKLVMIFDFTNPIDFTNFIQQCENFLKNKEVLKLITFDIFDFNNDGKISELDMFKVFQFFSKGQSQKLFENTFQLDLITTCKALSAKKISKENQINSKDSNHGQDQKRKSADSRGQYFRNYNNYQDTHFENKRKRLFQSMYKIKKLTQAGPNWGLQLLQLQKEIEQGDNSSDDEQMRKEENDMFGPSNYYYRQLMTQKQNRMNGKGAAEKHIEEYQKQMGDQMKNMQKVNRSSSLSKNTLSTNVEGQALQKQKQEAISYQTLLQNPQWDDFFNAYMEKTQSKINESIKLDEFVKLKFNEDLELPNFVIDFVDYLLGHKNVYKKLITKNITKQYLQQKEGNNFEDTMMSSSKMSVFSPGLRESQEDISQNNIKSMIKINDSVNASQSQLQLTQEQKKFQAELFAIKSQLNALQYKSFVNAFLILSGNSHETESKQQLPMTQQKPGGNLLGGFGSLKKTFGAKLRDAFTEKLQLMEYYITEQSMIENFSNLFGGHQVDIVAKLIYLYLSQGKDFVHLGIVQFGNVFIPLLNESKERRNEFVFRLLDVQNEKKLNILHLLQYFKNLKTNTLFGQEIYKIFMEYKQKNILMKAGFRSQIVLNFMTYNKLIKCSCLVNELQYRIFGGIYPDLDQNFLKHYISPFEELDSSKYSNSNNTGLQSQLGSELQTQYGSGLNSGMIRSRQEIGNKQSLNQLGSDLRGRNASQGPIRNAKSAIGGQQFNEGTIAEYMITDQQYENLFQESELTDASRILAKLK
eukprot:403356388